MTKQLHVLMDFPHYINGVRVRSFDQVQEIMGEIAEHSLLYGLWTHSKPKRENELPGGSLYLAWGKEIRFRLEFAFIQRAIEFNPLIEERFQNHWAFVCYPTMILTEPVELVRHNRYWRYYNDEDAPPDLGNDKINIWPD